MPELRVLHASFQRFWAPGIAAQLEAEQISAHRLSISWASRLFTSPPLDYGPSDVVVQPSVFRPGGATRADYYKWLRTQLEFNDVDLLLLRHISSAFDQYGFMKSVNVPVFLVHHTLEGPEVLSIGGVKGRAKILLESVSGFLSLRRSSGIVAMTPEIAGYERRRGLRDSSSVFVYPNGILWNDDEVEEDRRSGEVPVLLFVASHFAPWHGLDRLLDTALASDRPFIAHIVGEVGPDDSRKISSDSRFVAHGRLSQSQISRIVSQSWLGLSSFALDRKRMTQACTLKVREYLAHGLPVYSGHADVFDSAFQHYVHGPCDINRILELAFQAREWSRQEVALAARPHINKESLLGNLYRELTSYVRR